MKITPISDLIYYIEIFEPFDAHVASHFAQKIDVFKKLKQCYLIVNFANVSFIESTGLVTLVQSAKHCQENGGGLYLVEVQNSVRDVFELAHLDYKFDIFPVAADALADIHAKAE